MTREVGVPIHCVVFMEADSKGDSIFISSLLSFINFFVAGSGLYPGPECLKVLDFSLLFKRFGSGYNPEPATVESCVQGSTLGRGNDEV